MTFAFNDCEVSLDRAGIRGISGTYLSGQVPVLQELTVYAEWPDVGPGTAEWPSSRSPSVAAGVGVQGGMERTLPPGDPFTLPPTPPSYPCPSSPGPFPFLQPPSAQSHLVCMSL